MRKKLAVTNSIFRSNFPPTLNSKENFVKMPHGNKTNKSLNNKLLKRKYLSTKVR